jgi:hypothetical protein
MEPGQPYLFRGRALPPAIAQARATLSARTNQLTRRPEICTPAQLLGPPDIVAIAAASYQHGISEARHRNCVSRSRRTGILRVMPGLFDRRPNLDGMHPTDERPAYWADVFAEYEDTPYVIGLVNVCTVLGAFVGVWTLIILLGDLHHGFAVYWPLIMILATDTAVNVLVR